MDFLTEDNMLRFVLLFIGSLLAAHAGISHAGSPADNHTQPVSAVLTLKQEGQRLYAYVTVQQPQTEAGKIRIDWTPPPQSSCDKSSYILTYEGHTFHTRAYRTLGYSLINGRTITCTGMWRATVKTMEGTILTQATASVDSVGSYADAKMQSLAAIA
jgi:hypothetical protein